MSVPISVNNQQLGVRLLELPAELIDLLESEDPPVLQLKSTEASVSSEAQPNAVLCTRDQSFEVRQVQSSNLLYVLQQSVDSGFTIVAQCKGMLELVPSKEVALDFVRSTLPIYPFGNTGQTNLTRTSLQSDAPYSEKELADVLIELCAFEKNNSLWMPDAKSLVDIWKSLLTSIDINSINIERPLDIKKIAPQIVEDDNDVSLLWAVVARLSTTAGDREDVIFHRSSVTPWIGHALLASGDENMTKDNFLVQWEDLLPEQWKSGVDLNLLKDKYSLSGDDHITAISQPTAAAAKTSLPPKSKWHQKFRR